MENGKKPAFSVALHDNGNALHKEAMGLTKREYFAGLAMQSCLSTGKGSNAEDWVRIADALLAELDKSYEE
jgi:hypothetical protein